MKRLFIWIMSIAVLVIVFGTMYAAVQHAQRQAANAPQVQLAEDTAALLNQGISPANVLSGRVDMSTSLAPFVLIYDKHGVLVGGSGYIGNTAPTAPIGVLTNARGQDYSTVTWQPQNNIRVAAVTVTAKDYYVLSGRSLREVEKQEATTLRLTFLGGVIALVPLTAIFWADEIVKRLRPILNSVR